MNEEYYSYQETLEIVEKFMIDSGIREYCEKICKGRCCGSCFDSEKACFKNEGRRLPCSLYICGNLKRYLNSKLRDKWYAAAVEVERTIDELLGFQNPYWNVNTPELQKAFKVRKSLIDDMISNEFTIQIAKETMRELVDNKTQVRG